jgi:hypothetical protein
MESNSENFKPVKFNIPMLDEIAKGGLKKGELSIITGHVGPPKTDLVRFLPIKNEKGNYMVTMSLEMGDELTKKGVCVIQAMLDKMKKEGFDVSGFESRKTVTKLERFGDTVYPVNYHSNGVISVDYPQLPFCEQLRRKHFDK